jgi:hypothetical protein
MMTIQCTLAIICMRPDGAAIALQRPKKWEDRSMKTLTIRLGELIIELSPKAQKDPVRSNDFCVSKFTWEISYSWTNQML